MALHSVRPWIVLGLLVSLLAGCDKNPLAEVRGMVYYEGQPLPQGRIGFYPDEGRPAYGEIVEGKFQLTTIEAGDGALVGEHRVSIHSDAPTEDPFADAESLIPLRYRDPDTSGLTAEVVPGPNLDLRFELTK